MDELVSLVKVMRVGEKRMLTHMLSRTTNAEGDLRSRLFKLLDKGHADPQIVKEKLKSARSASSFAHLKRRLKEDILSVLLVKESSKRIAQANRAAQFDCIKKRAQAYVMIFRGAQTEGLKVLKKAILNAEKFELLGEKLQMNHLVRESVVSMASASELQRLNTEISNDLVRYQAILYVEEQSVLLANPEMGKGLRAKSNEKKYIQLIDELEKLYKKHKLARVGFWYYMAATEFHTAHKNFELVVDLGLSFLKLVQRSPAVKSKNNVAGVNQTVGLAQLELRNFSEAIGHLSVSEKYFPSAGFNRLQGLQFLALAEMAGQDYSGAMQTIGKAMAHPRIEVREHFLPRWLYIKACGEFLTSDTDSAFKTLNQNGYLMKQQDEWNIQYRLLEMLQLIEMGDEEWLDFKLDATRKFLTRHKNLDTARVRAAIDLISNLLRKELDFSGISEKNHKLLKLCLEESNGYEWNPTGAEIVRFDRWVQNKRLSQEAE
jgi:hypothetical protein